MSSITTQFDQPGYAIYQQLEVLFLKAASRNDFSTELKGLTSFYMYGNDLNEIELLTQIEIFGTNFIHEKMNVHEIIKVLQGLSASQQVFFDQICCVARLLVVVPATSAASKRSFLVMRRLKTYL